PVRVTAEVAQMDLFFVHPYLQAAVLDGLRAGGEPSRASRNASVRGLGAWRGTASSGCGRCLPCRRGWSTRCTGRPRAGDWKSGMPHWGTPGSVLRSGGNLAADAATAWDDLLETLRKDEFTCSCHA